MPENNNVIKYNACDPSYEQFYSDLPVPLQDDHMKIYVQGFEGGGFDYGTTQGRAANCYVAVSKALQLGLSLLDRNISRDWANKPSDLAWR